jgi:hypothetical protein
VEGYGVIAPEHKQINTKLKYLERVFSYPFFFYRQKYILCWKAGKNWTISSGHSATKGVYSSIRAHFPSFTKT